MSWFHPANNNSGEVGCNLREVITKRGITETELANLCDRSPAWISDVCAGRLPPLPYLYRIATYLGLTIEEIWPYRLDIHEIMIKLHHARLEVSKIELDLKQLLKHNGEDYA